MICVFNKIINDYHAISGSVQTSYFQLGNVSLLNRPMVSEDTMIAAGWEDAYGTATVFSVSYSAGDDETPWTQKIIVHMTPIKQNGTVLTQNQLDSYFDTLIEQTTISAMKSADNAADKLILWVQEVPGSWDDGWERAELFDDLLHRLQAVYYLNEFDEMPTNAELQEFNPNISINIVVPDYTTNGDAVLQPLECRIKNAAGGNYDLTLTHAIDPAGKWKHLQPGAIIRAPIPREEIENAFAGYEADVYKTTGKAELRESASEPTVISYPSWPNTTASPGAVGMKTSYQNKNYKCTYWDASSRAAGYPPPQVDWWEEIARYTSGAPVLVTLAPGTDLYFVEDYNTKWYKMSTYYGIVGYIKKSQVKYDRHLTPSETKPRIITEQLFRIEKPTVDTKNRTVTVTAKHVSYDLAGVLIKDVSIAQASPAMAIGRIVEGFMMDYNGTIATNLSEDDNGTYTQDIKGKNGIYALLDPDKGIVSTFNAAFKRDNWDLFVMTKESVDRGFRLQYRKNMLGVNWAQDSSGLVTRVVPIAKDETGADLYLPEVWVDSDYIQNYPVIRMERLSVSGQVGKAKDNSGQDLWTLSDLLDEMRTKAEERFTVDKADQVGVTVTVDFEQLGDTEEHQALKGLESVLLYDTVTVKNEEINLSLQLYVSEWEWDAIRQKITALKLVNTTDYKKGSVTGYNVQSKSISSEKLMDEVKDDIIGQVVDIIPEYADPTASRPATVTVSDGDPTLSWGTRSKVGTVQGTDLHVTGPADPRKLTCPVSTDGKAPEYLAGGAYIYIDGGSLTPGLYRANQSISAGTTLTSSNVEAETYSNVANSIQRMLEHVTGSVNYEESSIANVKSRLQTIISSMEDGWSVVVRISHTDSSDTGIMVNGYRYEGYLTKEYGDNSFSWLASAGNGDIVLFAYHYGTWTLKSMKAASQSQDGLMSSTDKTKLDGIETGANNTTVTDALNSTSTTNALSAAKGKTLNDNFNNFVQTAYSSFSAIPVSFRGFCNVVNVSSADANAPYPSATAGCWIVCQSGFASGTRVVQLAAEAFTGFSGKDQLWIRTRHDSSWSSWKKLNTITTESVTMSSWLYGNIVKTGITDSKKILSIVSDGYACIPIKNGTTNCALVFNAAGTHVTSGSIAATVYYTD